MLKVVEHYNSLRDNLLFAENKMLVFSILRFIIHAYITILSVFEILA